MSMQKKEKNPPNKKITLILSYVVSVALLGIVALDFMGYAIPLKPLIAHAGTYISPLNGGGSATGSDYNPAYFSCRHSDLQAYYFKLTGDEDGNLFWYACRS